MPGTWVGEGRGLIKVGTDVRAWALGFSGVSFSPGIRFWALSSAETRNFGLSIGAASMARSAMRDRARRQLNASAEESGFWEVKIAQALGF